MMEKTRQMGSSDTMISGPGWSSVQLLPWYNCTGLKTPSYLLTPLCLGWPQAAGTVNVQSFVWKFSCAIYKCSFIHSFIYLSDLDQSWVQSLKSLLLQMCDLFAVHPRHSSTPQFWLRQALDLCESWCGRPGLPVPSLYVSVSGKQHWTLWSRAQELCEKLRSPSCAPHPYGLCGRKATLNLK